MMDSKKKIILVVEDDLKISKLLLMRLEVNGYETIAARDGEEAIQKARESEPDLILMDLMLPKITGFEATQVLKFDEQYRHIPIIALSALSQQDEQKKALESGANAYFTKPFDFKQLIAKIQELTGQ